MKRALVILFLVLLVDQCVKFYVKTHFYYQEQVSIFGGEHAYIHFTENPGMAFGWELEGGYGKLILSLFRILAVTGIGWYLWDLVKKKAHRGLIAAIAFVFAGALGNIIDSCFYGLIFSESSEWTQDVAQFMPAAGGYAGFLHGKVVDMFYFPLFEGNFPSWFPMWGGQSFTFFSPVFNVADSAITIGVVMIIIFQRRFFGKKKQEEVPVPAVENNVIMSEGIITEVPPVINPDPEKP